MASQPLKKLVVNKFKKTHDHRSIIVDGVFGGFNHASKLSMNFFIEAIEVPENISFNADEEASGSVAIESVAEIKEIPVTILMDYNLSKKVLVWLTDQIKSFEKANPQKIIQDGSTSN